MDREAGARSSRLESAIGRIAGPFVILVAVSGGLTVILDSSVPLSIVIGIESFLVAIGGIGFMLVRFNRRGVLYARMSELKSGDRKLAVVLAVPTFVSAVLFAVSVVELDLLIAIEVSVLATGILLVSAGVRGKRNG